MRGLLLTALVTATAWTDGPAEWPMYRHDRAMTNRSEGGGGLERPEVAWQHDLRGYKAWVAVGERSRGIDDRDDHRTGEGLGDPMPLTAELRGEWGMDAGAPGYAADILPDTPGLERPSTVMIDNERGHCVLLAEDGTEIWRSVEFRVYQGPHPIVADANADGQLDVIACPHYQIVVMDGRTGEIIQQLRWHSGRNYGHFIAKNIDDDPALEFLVLADFYTHIDMIDNDGEALSLLWRKEIELKIEAKQKILRPRWDSLQDLDGDGQFEVITNLYNDEGDGRWHLMVYDALTGEEIEDVGPLFMEGLRDIDGDGRAEVFCTETEGLTVPRGGELLAVNVTRHGFRRILACGPSGCQQLVLDGEGTNLLRWEGYGAWATVTQRYPLNINSNVAHAERNVAVEDLGEDGAAFHVIEPPKGKRGARLVRYVMSPDGKTRKAWTFQAPRGARTVDIVGEKDGQALVSVQVSDAKALAKAGGRIVAWERTLPRRAKWGNVIAADMDGKGELTIAATAANDRVLGLTSDGEPRWERTGAGTIAAGDLDADGDSELAFLGWDESGNGVATAVDGRGKAIWSERIGRFPGPMEPWNFGTLTTLGIGKLSGGAQDDVIVFARRSTMHSDEGYALRGTDGEVLWHRDGVSDGGTTTWGFGGTPVVMVDVNGDGCEDVVSEYPVNLSVVSGKDGEQLVGRTAANDSIFPGVWAAYASPTLWDYDG
ncbi:MAG TPA: hypothetical protein QGH10_10235, partial [Armatimonadota bacterium]|nr:hypothetical protein [Armatimonadota bacterium]